MSGKNSGKNLGLESRLALDLPAIDRSKQQVSSVNAKAESFRKQADLLRSKTYMARAKLMELKTSLESETSGFSKKSEDGLKDAKTALVVEPKARSASSQMRALSNKLFTKPEKS